jgi:DNA-binding CsgD family transcriptional regulator
MNGRSQRIWWAVLGFGAFTTLMIIDVATEHEVQSLGEFLADTLELGLIVASATGVALLTGSLQTERNEKNALARDLKIARAEGEAWRKRAQFYLAGLGEEIEAQFESWQLTQSEREIGLLMLKGFSHGEISGLRGTTEATVRHQARAVYQKSGMPGRSAFCAYFLEDLLPANGQNGARNGAPSAATRVQAEAPDARVT